MGLSMGVATGLLFYGQARMDGAQILGKKMHWQLEQQLGAEEARPGLLGLTL